MNASVIARAPTDVAAARSSSPRARSRAPRERPGRHGRRPRRQGHARRAEPRAGDAAHRRDERGRRDRPDDRTRTGSCSTVPAAARSSSSAACSKDEVVEAGRLRRHRGHAARRAARHLSAGNPDRPRHERRPERRRQLQADPGRAVRRLLVARLGRRPRPDGAAGEPTRRGQSGRTALPVAIVQVSLLSSVDVAGGMPNLLLVTIVSVALLRGSVVRRRGRVLRRPAARHREPRDARPDFARSSPSAATGSAATARRPAATAPTRRSSPSPSSRSSTRSACSCCTSCSAIRCRRGGCSSTRSSRRSPSTYPHRARLLARAEAAAAGRLARARGEVRLLG